MNENHDEPILLVAYSGLFCANANSHWQYAREYFAREGIRLLTPHIPGFGYFKNYELGKVSIECCVEKMTYYHRALDRPAFTIGHSVGTIVQAEVAHQVPDGLIRGIVGVNPTVVQGINLGHKIRMAKYLLQIISNKEVIPTEKDVIFMRDSSNVDIGPAPGKMLKQLAAGFPATPMYSLNCPSLLFAGQDDHIIPPKVADQIGRYHRVPMDFLPGGHYGMWQQEYRDHWLYNITQLLQRWNHLSSRSGGCRVIFDF